MKQMHLYDMLTPTRPRSPKQPAADFDVKVLSVVLPCLAELSAVRIHMNQVHAHPLARGSHPTETK